MHHQRIEFWQHHHTFNIAKKAAEKRTLIVVLITCVTMIVEILFGWLSKSMALLADGWHMGTHAFALGISLLAYILARKYSQDPRFTFGTWKIEILGAYTSAIVLGLVGCIMIFSSIERILNPVDIQFNQALLVAIIGLVVNLVCALILNMRDHPHEHHHHHSDHDSAHDHHHEDLNLKSAYLHVVADAMTSVLAIVAITGAKYLHQLWLDPLMALVGAGLIIRWATGLIKNSAGILLQLNLNFPLAKAITTHIESDGDTKISDLHIWKVAQNRYACIVALVTARNHTLEEYKKRLKHLHELAHITIEMNLYKSS